MSEVAENPAAGLTGFRNNRWLQLIIAIVAMVIISGVEYGWSLYAPELSKKLGQPNDVIQVAFTLGLIGWGVGQPVIGPVADKIGPRWPTIIAGIVCGFGWLLMGQVNTVFLLYVFYFLAGCGGGLVYGMAMGTSTRWFPDKRGMANGWVAAGFGGGSLVFLGVINNALKTSVATAFTRVGWIMVIALVIMGFILKWPEKKPVPATQKTTVRTDDDLTPTQILGTGQFWSLWVTFVGMQLGGLLLTANDKPYAKHIGLLAAAITLGVTMKSLGNAGSRVLWGWISDYVGRYRTMGIVFTINAIIMFLFPTMAKTGTGFVIAMLLAFVTWGEVYSLMPTANADVFGTKYATSSYGLLYTAKSVASIFGGGLGAWVAVQIGWQGAFNVAGIAALFAALMAVFVIPRLPAPKSRRQKLAERTSS